MQHAVYVDTSFVVVAISSQNQLGVAYIKWVKLPRRTLYRYMSSKIRRCTAVKLK